MGYIKIDKDNLDDLKNCLGKRAYDICETVPIDVGDRLMNVIYEFIEDDDPLSIEEFRVGFEYEEHVLDSQRYLSLGMIWKSRTYGCESPRLHKIQKQLDQGNLRRKEV